jgi:DNA-binding CsgD family transcriptional regulator
MPDNIVLSERELEILRLVATGASNKEIAQQLFISPNTVKVHLKNVFAKIGVASRTEAAMAAVQLGLVDSGIAAITTAAEANEQAQTETSLDGDQPHAGEAAVGTWRSYRWIAALTLLVLLATSGVLLASGRLIAAPALASPQPPTAISRWQERADLLTARSGLAVAAFENQVYAIGGETEEGVTGKAERYNPETDQWDLLASKPTPVADAGAAVIGGLIYIPGGRLASGTLSSVLEVYDPYQNRWEQRASLPAAISAFALTAFEGRLFVFGGWNGQEYLDTVFEYDPGQDAWQERTAMPTARGFASAAVAGGRIYIIGGFDGQKALPVNEAYQPARDNGEIDPWFHMKPMPAGRYGMGVASLADIIHIIGGEGEAETQLLPLKYFPQLDEWQELEGENLEALQSWSHLQLAPIETNIYAVGGARPDGPTAQNMVYQAIYTVVIPVVR